MPKFRKKPVVIDAFHWEPLSDKKPFDIPNWLVMSNYDIAPDNSILIKTLEGIMRADPGDWIIHGVKGEVYPCKPDIFAATYEAVAEGATNG